MDRTYSIHLIVQRMDGPQQPSGYADIRLDDIPAEAAEDPGYILATVINMARRFWPQDRKPSIADITEMLRRKGPGENE